MAESLMKATATFEDLQALISSLIEELSCYSIRSIYIQAFLEMQNIDWAQPDKMLLHSPFRQVSYIVSLAMSVKQRAEAVPLEQDNWKKICLDVNEIYDYYSRMNFPKNGDFSEMTDEEYFQGSVASPSFLLSISTGTTLSVEQIKEDIRDCYSFYQSQLKGQMGIGIDDIISICDFITGTLSKRYSEGWFPMLKAWREFRKKVEEGKDPKEVLVSQKELSADVFNHIENSGIVSRKDVERIFGAKVTDTFLNLFCQARTITDDRIIIFPTDELSIDTKGIADVGNNEISIITGNHLYLSVRASLYKCIEKIELTEKFHMRRGEVLEAKVLSCLKQIFGNSAQYYCTVYETPKDQNEHDILLVFQRKLLIIECKAKSIEKRFRDIEKAFKRITQGFKKSIQEGYDQCRSLEKLILSQEETQLYYKGGTPAVKLRKGDFDQFEKIIFTYDNEGLLATKLSLLLKIEPGDNYPLCMNINDLLQLASFKKYINLTGEGFFRYLLQRKFIHQKISNDDELDIWGFFLQKGSLDEILDTDCDLFYIPPAYSKIFDEAYLDQSNESMFKSNSVQNVKKIGRNEPCPCGSGFKFKRCHGKQVS